MDRQPVFNVPGVVLALAGLLVAVHAALALVATETANWWVLALAFIPARFADLPYAFPGGAWAPITSWLSHALVHGDLMHLGVNLAFFLAFGSACARRIGAARFALLMIASTIAGAAAYLAFNGLAEVVMIGASGAISGLVGAVLRFLHPALAVTSGPRLAEAVARVPRLSLGAMWRERDPRNAVLSWLALNITMAIVMPAAGLTRA